MTRWLSNEELIDKVKLYGFRDETYSIALMKRITEMEELIDAGDNLAHAVFFDGIEHNELNSTEKCLCNKKLALSCWTELKKKALKEAQ